jgi:hypothetical protein
MKLEEILNYLPGSICLDNRHYYLFIAKGTRTNDKWIVGYSDYERELTTPIEDYDLRMALCLLLNELEVMGLWTIPKK